MDYIQNYVVKRFCIKERLALVRLLEIWKTTSSQYIGKHILKEDGEKD